MNPEIQLNAWKRRMQPIPREEHVLETIQKSKEAFFAAEQDSVLPYHEFLWIQFRLIRKRWWLLQLIALFVLWLFLMMNHESAYIQKAMGVIAPLFVILAIPELWRNHSFHSMEIECASYYTLRRIYAARMLLFGAVDILLVTIFCKTASIGLHYELTELLVQFLFPMCITACICFYTLYSRHGLAENSAVILCLLWGALWLLVILNERVYALITLPVWFCLSGLALCCLLFSVYRALHLCNRYWEVTLRGFHRIKIS